MNKTRDQKILREIFSKSLEIGSPEHQVVKLLKVENQKLSWDSESIRLADYDRVFVFGAGKASKSMAIGLHSLLKDKIYGGAVICPDPFAVDNCNINFLPGNHPIPDKESIDSTDKLIRALSKTTENDLVFFLISGGASSMICKPNRGVRLKDIQSVNEKLLKSGLSIYEMNRRRKEISAIKGGKLLDFTKSNRIINLLISDVPGNDPNVIGSGPTQANNALSSHHKSISNIWINTPELFAKNLAITAETILKDVAIQIHPEPYSGSTQHVSTLITSRLMKHLKNNKNDQPKLFIFYGESEVNVTGDGKGGRNQHLSLHFLIHDMPKFQNRAHLSMMSVGSDGIDGNTNTAGAIIDSDIIKRINELEINPLEYLNQYNSYNFFEKLGASVITVPTGNNLMDFQLLLVRNEKN